MKEGVDNPTALATRDQRRAANPVVSAWVSASAGSGKTQVLRDRVLRLLLEGAAPERILCLTFTKAGASEMSNRIAATLAEWASMPEAALKAQLKTLAGDGGLTRRMAVARGLFAKVLDAPGGMRIETIHAFCQSLLRRFPLEARVAPHFRLIEERDASALLLQAREGQLTAAQLGHDARLSMALAHLVQGAGETGIDNIVSELLRDRARLSGLQRRMGDIDAYRRALAALLEIPPDTDRQAVLAAAVDDAVLDAAALRAATRALTQGSKTDVERAAILEVFLAADQPGRVAVFDAYLSVFLTAAQDIRARLATKGAIQAMPTVERVLTVEAERLQRVLEMLRAIDILADSVALVTLGLDLFARFRRLKDVTAALDFDDLILATRDLLLQPGIAPWVLYKLDGGIDHVLIDEGQDTSPAQWEIIKALSDELIAGSGADRRGRSAPESLEKPRSIFAVGDFKQSIFSFQGAEPRAFLGAREHFRERLTRMDGARDSRTPFEDVPLIVSFRSGPAVLRVVDQVFAGNAGAGLVEKQGRIQHIPARSGAAGLVEVWPRATPLEARLPAPWAPPSIDADPGDPGSRVANAIADKISELVGGGYLEAQGRPIMPGDIMVLVRSRNAFVPTLVKALKARQVEVSGIDRLALLSELAVMDLVAMIDFLLLPEDDLNFAALLKSPLVGFDEDDLFSLCIARGDRTLWQQLNQAEIDDARWRAVRDFLLGYLQRAQSLTPYELLADLLSAGGGRQKLFARLGLQVGEAIEELLNLALLYETNNLPSLQGFRHWLEIGEAVVKRELTEDGGGQVRIMTVHGAKGLQAPIVFVADAQRRKPNRPGLFWLGAEAAGLPVWVQRKEMDVSVTATARAALEQRAEEEENRLLYVALTRAEDRLYVCGWRGRNSSSSPSWHDSVADAVAGIDGAASRPASEWRAEDGWEGDWRSYVHPQVDPAKEKAVKIGLPVDLAVPLPPWATMAASAEPDPPRPLIPSRPSTEAAGGGEAPILSPLGHDQGFRFQRGLVIHKLFQLLPELPPADRRAAALHWLQRVNRPSGLLAEDDALADIVNEVMAVLEDESFAPLFVPGSRAEVPIVADLPRADGGREILSGQIDRLVVTAHACHIIDFKSNRPPAMRPEHVSRQYLRQLALYKSAILRIYPDRAVTCYLLWSAVPHLMPIPDSLLESYALGTSQAPGWVSSP